MASVSRSGVKILCPGCGKDSDTWVYDRRIDDSRGGGKARSHDVVQRNDGTAEWFRYRCRGCRHEWTWPAKLIASAHFRALRLGRRTITVEDLLED